MRYQTALRPVRRGSDTRHGRDRQEPFAHAQRSLWNSAACTRSPEPIPSSTAFPPLISRTARTGSAERMGVVDSGTALGAMLEIVPSERMNSMSSETYVFFIQNDILASL